MSRLQTDNRFTLTAMLVVLSTALLGARPANAQLATDRAGFRPANETRSIAMETGAISDPVISLADLKKHVTVLASDTFEGREAGSRGGHAAAAYIVDQLRSAAIEPVPGHGFLQEFGNGYRNVLALIPGSNSELQDQIVLVGGHFDHVGFGNRENSNGQVGQIHNGADDNASGVSALIELAKHFGQHPPARPLLFAFWDAEEKGLLGSEYWVSTPTIDRRHIRFAFNTDMIGRLRNGDLEILGTRTAAGLRKLVSTANQPTDLTLDFNWDIVRDSDHYPFVERGIPFLMLCTKKHKQYHHPDDDIHTLNFKGMQQVTQVLHGAVQAMANGSRIPAYRSTSRFETQETKKQLARIGRRQPSRLGITYTVDRDNGPVLVKSVAPNSAAAQAGLRPGDRIVEFNDRDPARVDFSSLVQTAPALVSVVFHRPGQSPVEQVEMRLAGKPVRFGLQVRDDEAEPGSMVVASTLPGLPADVSGLKPHDRIHAIDDRSFGSGEEFWQRIKTMTSSTRLTIERDGHIRQLLLSVAESSTPISQK